VVLGDVKSNEEVAQYLKTSKKEPVKSYVTKEVTYPMIEVVLDEESRLDAVRKDALEEMLIGDIRDIDANDILESVKRDGEFDEFAIAVSYKDKFEYSGLTKAKSNLIDVARVAESPIQYECKYIQTIRIPANDTLATVDVIIGQVIGIHIADEYILPDGKIDICRIQPVARLGYFDFTVVNNSFEMAPPKVDDPENQRLVDKGLEGKV